MLCAKTSGCRTLGIAAIKNTMPKLSCLANRMWPSTEFAAWSCMVLSSVVRAMGGGSTQFEIVPIQVVARSHQPPLGRPDLRAAPRDEPHAAERPSCDFDVQRDISPEMGDGLRTIPDREAVAGHGVLD